MTSPRSEIFVSWDEIQSLCHTLASEIISKGLRRDKILAITRGGLFPAGLLARELNVKRIETIGVVTYDAGSAGIGDAGKANLVKEPDSEFLKDCLIIDDLVDTGTTLDFIRPKTTDCIFATVFAKPQGEDRVDLFAKAVAQETWIRFPWDTRRQFVEPLVK